MRHWPGLVARRRRIGAAGSWGSACSGSRRSRATTSPRPAPWWLVTRPAHCTRAAWPRPWSVWPPTSTGTALAADQHRHGLEVSLTTSLPEGLPVSRQVVILRTVQESLSNVVRHAQARNAQISAGVQDGEIVIAVRDDGRGTRGAPEGTGLIVEARMSL